MLFSLIQDQITKRHRIVKGLSRYTPMTGLFEADQEPHILEAVRAKITGKSTDTIKLIRKDNPNHRTIL